MDKSELNNLIKAWNLVVQNWPSKSKKSHSIAVVNDQDDRILVFADMFHLSNYDLSHIIHNHLMDMLENDLRTFLIMDFWAYFNDTYEDPFWKFPKAVNSLFHGMESYFSIAVQIQSILDSLPKYSDEYHGGNGQCKTKHAAKNFHEEMLLVLRAILFQDWPSHFRSILVGYYNKTFQAFHGKQKGSLRVIQVEGHKICIGCDKEVTTCCCEAYLTIFNEVNCQLFELQLLDYLVGDIPVSVAQENTEKHILQTCVGNYEVSYLPILKNWLQDVPLTWLSSVFVADRNQQWMDSLLDGYKGRLTHALYDAYAKVRLNQMFNVIIEFPDSKAAIEDLKECINISGLRSKLVLELRTAMKRRLLHPGVNTADILTAYISSIKALRVLDSSGVVLQLVCEPVCKYLRSREDTVRCIVSSLTDDSCEELANELMKGSPLVLEDSYQSDEENEDWENWTPDPVDADPNKIAKGQRSSDIISMLVNIYGSKELFVNEYRTLLADRLLSTFSYNNEKEIRYLELLKLRFGEAQLHYCEVMLKDIADSKRINTHLNSGEMQEYSGGDFPVNTMILSAQFWPPFKEEKLKLPEYLWDHLKKYTAAFQILKGNRTLVWKPHLGQVNIEIELKERTLELAVSPAHATILWHFQDKAEWHLDDLSNVMQMKASVLRRKITFWQSHGILREEETDVFYLTEEQKDPSGDAVVIVDDEMESVTASSLDQREEELQTFWHYIIGMLTNMESLPLERIHSMLRMFAMQGPNTNEFTMQGMKQFLDKKVRERELLFSGGLYRLPRYES